MTPSAVDETRGAATWGGPVLEDEFLIVESALAAPLPLAWKDYLRRDRWLSRGWLRSGAFMTLLSPNEAQSLMSAWDEALDAHPGFYPLGTDGSRLLYCVDLTEPELGVMITDIAASGWDEAEIIDYTVEEFVASIDDGSFHPYPPADS